MLDSGKPCTCQSEITPGFNLVTVFISFPFRKNDYVFLVNTRWRSTQLHWSRGQSLMATDLRCLSPAFSNFCHFSSEQKGHVNRSRGQIYRQIAGLASFSTVAGSYSSLSSKTLMLPVSHFTSSGQRAKLTVLGYVPSLPSVCYVLLYSLVLMRPPIVFFPSLLLLL